MQDAIVNWNFQLTWQNLPCYTAMHTSPVECLLEFQLRRRSVKWISADVPFVVTFIIHRHCPDLTLNVCGAAKCSQSNSFHAILALSLLYIKFTSIFVAETGSVSLFLTVSVSLFTASRFCPTFSLSFAHSAIPSSANRMYTSPANRRTPPDRKYTVLHSSWVPYKANTGRERLIRSHSSARFCFELSGNSN